MSRKMTELPPCPCCGEQPEATFVRLPYLHGCWHIDCTNPECTKKPGTWYYYHYKDAASEWKALAESEDE